MTPTVATHRTGAAFIETGARPVSVVPSPIVVRSRLFSWAGRPEEPIDKDRNAQGHDNHHFSWRNGHSAASAIGIAPLCSAIRRSTLSLGMSVHLRAARGDGLQMVAQVAQPVE